jgi:hypothetical protein
MDLLVPEHELTDVEWLRRYALSKLKYGGNDKTRILVIAEYLELTERVRDQCASMLEHIAMQLKGPPEPDTAHGWEDLPKLIAELMKGREPFKPEGDTLQ